MKSPTELAIITKRNGLNFDLVPIEEKQKHFHDLCDIYDRKIAEATTFYKVLFQKCFLFSSLLDPF
jgi:hypothetical protein